MHKAETTKSSDYMSQFPVLFHTGRFKNMVEKLISVLLDAAWRPENIDG